MGKVLSAFTPIGDVDDLFTATRDNLRCTAFRLRSGGLCLFSPVKGLNDQALASLGKLGPVEALLAPNHWHNQGLHEYVKAFPDASLHATPAAAARLGIITQLRFSDVAKLQDRLPEGSTFVVPAGLKTGEVWLSITRPRRRVWTVVDAFCGAPIKKGRGLGEPDILKTFPKFGVGDRSVYLPWLARRIDADRPTMIVPCHGAISTDPRLSDKLRQLVAAKL